MKQKTIKIKDVIEAVPKSDIEAPIKAAIAESTDYETGLTPKNRFIYVLGMVGFIGISLLACGVLFFYLTGFKGKSEDKTIKIVEQKQANEEKISFDRASITFEVLNGSGVSGAAKVAGGNIESLGYQLIGTGNAGQVKGNKLYLKSDLSAFSTEIISDLSGFNISTVSGSLDEGTASARLILGTK